MGLFKKKVPEATGEKKDLKANYTTEDHKTDLDVLLNSLNTHPANVGPCIEPWGEIGGSRCSTTAAVL